MTRVKLDGKVILERDVERLTCAEIRAHLEATKVLPKGRRAAVRQAAETKLLEQLAANTTFTSETVELKSIPGATVKG
jgi:hypothetical protein